WFSTRWVAKRSCADMGASARKTKPRARRGFKAYCFAVRLLHHRDPGSLRALRTLHHFEADALAFLQRAEAIGVDRGIMDEHVVAAVLGRDEAEALGVVEPFHGTESHAQPLGRLKVYACVGSQPPSGWRARPEYQQNLTFLQRRSAVADQPGPAGEPRPKRAKRRCGAAAAGQGPPYVRGARGLR